MNNLFYMVCHPASLFSSCPNVTLSKPKVWYTLNSNACVMNYLITNDWNFDDKIQIKSDDVIATS